jgi:cellulose biosynthesis protein BcsQ
MALVGIANIKGGQGKTTWACSLASFLEAEIFDLNPENGDAFAWAEEGTRHPARLVYPTELGVLEEASKGKPWVVADCPPWDGPETRAVLGLAKAILIPVASGYQDLRGLARMLDLVREAREHANPKLVVGIMGNGRRAVAFTEPWETALKGCHDSKRRTHYLGTVPQRQAFVDAFGANQPTFHAPGLAGQEAREFLTKFVSLFKS